MPMNPSRLAYDDISNLLDSVLEDPKGARVKFEKPGDAFYFRIRVNTFRNIDRKDNIHLYDKGHPLYGRSIYDKVVARIRRHDGFHWVYLEKWEHSIDGRVEMLSDLPEESVIEESTEVGQEYEALEIAPVNDRPQKVPEQPRLAIRRV